MAWKERYSRSCCPPIFFDRKAWDGALACADVLLALVKEPCLQCLGLGLLVMLQGRYWIDQFRRVIGAQTDSAAPTGSMSLRLVGLGSFTLCLVSNAAGLFRLLGCRKVSRSAFCLKRRLTGFVSFLALAFGICSLFRFQMLQPRHKRLLGNRDNQSIFALLFVGDRRPFRLNGLLAIVEWLRSEEHTSELQSLMRISYAVFCLKKKKKTSSK